MRYFPTTLFAAGLAFALAAPAAAAPNSINDCEKIEAADAYNQCLALFGPVAHTHGASTKDFGGDGVGGADVVETANPEASVPLKEAHASRGRHSRGHWAHHARHQYYGHNFGGHHGHSSAHETHGRPKRVAFNVISGHTKTR
ncbi:MAG: hypothetical protein ACLPSF_07540 [Methylocella sp.]